MNKQIIINEGIKSLYERIGQLNKKSVLTELSNTNINLLSSSEISCIQYIYSIKNANVTKLAEATGMTTSAISKVIKKLEGKGYILRYEESSNKKEVYFSLTSSGKDIYDFHEKTSHEFLICDQPFYDQFSENDLNTIITFIDQYREYISKLENKE